MAPFLLFSALFPWLASRAAPPGDGLYASPSWKQPIEPISVAVFSISNDNRSFLAHFTSRRRPWHGREAWLLVGGQAVAGSWSDGVDHPSAALFQLDLAQARAVADRYGVPLRLRTPLGEDLRAEWSVPSGTTVRLRLINEGAPTVLWVSGVPTASSNGYGQLTFQVLQDGVELAPRAPIGPYVGPVAVRSLGTGAQLVLDTDLSALFPLEPGLRYEVRCTYDGVAVATEGLPAWPEQAHRAWTLRFEGVVTLGQ